MSHFRLRPEVAVQESFNPYSIRNYRLSDEDIMNYILKMRTSSFIMKKRKNGSRLKSRQEFNLKYGQVTFFDFDPWASEESEKVENYRFYETGSDYRFLGNFYYQSRKSIELWQ